MPVRSVVVLGSTGSIGTQALDLVRRNPDRFRVVGLAAGGRNPALLAAQVAEFRPEAVAVGRPETGSELIRAADLHLDAPTDVPVLLANLELAL